MKRVQVPLLVIVIIALLIGSKLLFFPKADDKTAGAKKQSGGQPLPVSYFVVKPASFSNEVYATGKVGALNQVDLVPETAGKVVKIYFSEGSAVEKGALLVKLNDADLQAQLGKIRSQMRVSGQRLERVKRLLEVSGVSREEFEMQENELNTLRADEAFVLAQIARTNIVAPFSGVIGLKNVSEGAYVSASTPVVSLVQMKPVFIEFAVAEKYQALFRKGNRIRFMPEGRDSSSAYHAEIYAIEPKVDEVTRTIRARALYKGEEPVYPGAFVRVFLNLGETRDALMVPTQCVIPVLQGQKVMAVRNGTVEEVMVKTGLRTEARIQVTDGLRQGDTLVATGILSVRPGHKVQLTTPLP